MMQSFITCSAIIFQQFSKFIAVMSELTNVLMDPVQVVLELTS